MLSFEDVIFTSNWSEGSIPRRPWTLCLIISWISSLADFATPIKFTIEDCQKLINEINSQKWDKLPADNKFLMGLYKKLFELGIVPEEVEL